MATTAVILTVTTMITINTQVTMMMTVMIVLLVLLDWDVQYSFDTLVLSPSTIGAPLRGTFLFWSNHLTHPIGLFILLIRLRVINETE